MALIAYLTSAQQKSRVCDLTGLSVLGEIYHAEAPRGDLLNEVVFFLDVAIVGVDEPTSAGPTALSAFDHSLLITTTLSADGVLGFWGFGLL